MSKTSASALPRSGAPRAGWHGSDLGSRTCVDLQWWSTESCIGVTLCALRLPTPGACNLWTRLCCALTPGRFVSRLAPPDGVAAFPEKQVGHNPPIGLVFESPLQPYGLAPLKPMFFGGVSSGATDLRHLFIFGDRRRCSKSPVG